MPIKQQIKKYLPILIAVLLIFQLAPGANASVEHSDKCASKSSLTLLNRTVHHGISLLTRQNQKSPFNPLAVGHIDSIIDNIYSGYISEDLSSYFKTPIDCRSGIKQSIPQHFHGSKYKNIYLLF